MTPEVLACPSCKSLLHANDLERLAGEAKAASDRGDPAAALASWRKALALLPNESVQYRSVQKRIEDLEKLQPQPGGQQPQGTMGRWAAKLGPLGVILWKFKVIALVVLGKAKLILLGLTKLTTLTTMLASLGVYWAMYGWKFGLGLLLSIYIHEMGHVFELRRFGIAASAPVFLPGFGALVMLKQRPATPGQDARVGLAGPVWGLATACLCYGLFLLTKAPFWAALARFGAWINLFNLIPVWQLDGSRGFAALTRTNRAWILGIVLTMWVLTNDAVLFLVALGCGYRLFTHDFATAEDPPVFRKFAALLILLAILCLTPKA